MIQESPKEVPRHLWKTPTRPALRFPRSPAFLAERAHTWTLDLAWPTGHTAGGRGGQTDSTSGRSGHYPAQPAPHCRHPTAGRERRGEGHPRAERNNPPRREGYSSTNSGPMGRRPQWQFTEAPGAGVPPHLPQEPASPQPRQRPRDTCLAAPGFGSTL